MDPITKALHETWKQITNQENTKDVNYIHPKTGEKNLIRANGTEDDTEETSRRIREAEELRRSKLTPQERAEEDDRLTSTLNRVHEIIKQHLNPTPDTMTHLDDGHLRYITPQPTKPTTTGSSLLNNVLNMHDTYSTPLSVIPRLYEERDAEGQMAKGELMNLASKAQDLASMMKDDTQLEAWVQSKITKAKDYISSVHDYMNGNPDKID